MKSHILFLATVSQHGFSLQAVAIAPAVSASDETLLGPERKAGGGTGSDNRLWDGDISPHMANCCLSLTLSHYLFHSVTFCTLHQKVRRINSQNSVNFPMIKKHERIIFFNISWAQSLHIGEAQTYCRCLAIAYSTWAACVQPRQWNDRQAGNWYPMEGKSLQLNYFWRSVNMYKINNAKLKLWDRVTVH